MTDLLTNDDALEEIAVVFSAGYTAEEFRAEVGKILDHSEKYTGLFAIPEVEHKFKLLIAGGRDFNDYFILKDEANKILRNVDGKIVIVAGGARGADNLAKLFAREMNYEYEEHPADWDKHGKSAGYIRNNEMAKSILENKDGALLAFWDKQSRGTYNMIDIAKTRHIPTTIVNY